MDITCQECGAKTPMGAIFCRECGAKIDMDAVQPKVINKSTDGGFKFTKLAVRRLISLAISIVIFGSLAMLLIDDAPTLPDSPSNQKEVGIVKAIYRQLAAPQHKYKKFPAISGAGVSHYFTNELTERQSGQEGEATMMFKEAIFEFYDENKIKMDLRAEVNAYGIQKNLSMQIIVSFENEDDGVVFTVEKAKHGKIPLPALQDKLVYSRFERLVPDGDDFNNMIDKLKALTITDDGKLAIELK
ncbi:MAG: zinc ribbon domain-containing protein [Lentisphaeraceae bacterium]|nr:zinc ribbon domain-containing protein [Lentisphaeraceae bacterium]